MLCRHLNPKRSSKLSLSPKWKVQIIEIDENGMDTNTAEGGPQSTEKRMESWLERQISEFIPKFTDGLRKAFRFEFLTQRPKPNDKIGKKNI